MRPIQNHEMKTRSRYHLTIEDEGRLEKIADFSTTGLKWLTVVMIGLIFIMLAGVLIVFLSPVRTLLPGYLKASERSATEMQIMRLDSLRTAYETNAAFIENLRFVLNPHRPVTDSSALPGNIPVLLPPDSLLPTSPEEIRFSAMMKDRDKYNVSVVAPLAAESMMFTPVNETSVVSLSTRPEPKAEIILAEGSTIASIADGTVISVSQSVRNGGSIVIIQHPKGFLSRLSRLGTVIVEPGDMVSGGQIIAFSNRGNALKGEHINLEMWYNGTPLRPYEYIGDYESATHLPISYKKVELKNMTE